jgi:hypothetical protein
MKFLYSFCVVGTRETLFYAAWENVEIKLALCEQKVKRFLIFIKSFSLFFFVPHATFMH